jgi:hypothetical protein
MPTNNIKGVGSFKKHFMRSGRIAAPGKPLFSFTLSNRESAVGVVQLQRLFQTLKPVHKMNIKFITEL